MLRTEIRLHLPFVLLACKLILIGPCVGQDVSAKPTLNAELDSQRAFIAVTFAGGKPDAAKALDAQAWRIVEIPYDPKSSPIVLSVKPEFFVRRNGTIDKAQVRLVAPKGHLIPKDIDLIIVEFNPQGIKLSTIWKSPRNEAAEGTTSGSVVKQNPDTLIPASNKQNAAIYFSGLYSPAIGNPPQFSVDAVLNPQFHLSENNLCDPRLGFNAQIKTDKRPTVDPDSYVIAPSYSMFILGCGATSSARYSGRSVLFTWDIFGPEFEAKGKDLNLVSAPMLSNFFRVWPLPSKATTTKESATVYLSPTIGLEVGTNTKNGLEANGSGVIFRGVMGVDLSVRYQPSKSFVLKKVLLSASYRARIPAFSEISTNTVMLPGSTKATDIFSLSSVARNHVQSELDFMFTDVWGITLKDEYGRIPPAFRLVENNASIGLVFMFSQAGNSKQKVQP